MYSPLKVSGKKRDGNYLLWGVVITLIGKYCQSQRVRQTLREISEGTTILTATHSVLRGVQLDLLQGEVRELRAALRELREQENEVEVELERTRWVGSVFRQPHPSLCQKLKV